MTSSARELRYPSQGLGEGEEEGEGEGEESPSDSEGQPHLRIQPSQSDVLLGKRSWEWSASSSQFSKGASPQLRSSASSVESEESPLLAGDPLRRSSTSSSISSLPGERVAVGQRGSLPRRVLSRPWILLVFLSLLALMNYYDRGAFVGILPLISEEFGMSDSQAGIIGGAFIVGYSLVSPLMAQLSRRIASGTLLMAGMLVWVLATGLCMFAQGFWYLVVLRCFVGIGEAAFICLSPSLIDDVAPPEQRTRWLAIFFSTLPIGYSLGYLGAGLIAKYLTWEWVFFLEAAITLPLALLCFFLPNVKTMVKKEEKQSNITARLIDEEAAALHTTMPSPPHLSSNSPRGHISLLASLSLLAKNSVYVTMTLGYCAQTFVLGALTFWLPAYVMNEYELPLDTANFVIGAVTAICGIFGNLCSSFLMDYLVARKRKDPRSVGVYMSFIFTTLALPFAFVAVFMTTIELFLFFMLCAEFLMLFTVTPVNSVFLNCVQQDLRGHSVAVATLMIHLLGDLSSPYVFGAISDATGSQRYSLFFMSCWMGWTCLFWFAACFLIRRRISKEIPRVSSYE